VFGAGPARRYSSADHSTLNSSPANYQDRGYQGAGRIVVEKQERPVTRWIPHLSERERSHSAEETVIQCLINPGLKLSGGDSDQKYR